jgi:serine/threonine protein kinase
MEAFVLRSIRHEGVVGYIDLFEDERYFYLVCLLSSLRSSSSLLTIFPYFFQVMEHHGTPWQNPDKHDAPMSRSGPADLPFLASAPMQPQLSSNLPRILNGPQTITPTSSPTLSSPLAKRADSPGALCPPRPAPMERRSSCDLFECIEQHSRFDEATAKYVFAQVVEIIYALGQMGICHRDLKDENIVRLLPSFFPSFPPLLTFSPSSGCRCLLPRQAH